MKRSDTRYKGVWDAAYREGIADVDQGVRLFLMRGGRIALMPFSGDFVVKYPNDGISATCGSLAALAVYRPEKP